MAIKLIATDMDGTFLNSSNTYNKERFNRLFLEMERRNILFVVASGNQYYQLKSFFTGLDDKISYVAENGGFLIDKGEELFAAKFSEDDINKILMEMGKHNGLLNIVCGKKSAYCLKTDPQDIVDIMRTYYHRLQLVNAYTEIEDQLFKFNLIAPTFTESEQEDFVEELRRPLEGITTVVTSGRGCMDLIKPGVNKAFAIQMLADKYHISNSEIMAFGDQYNDLEMLNLAGHPYIMENAPNALKIQFPDSEAPSNDDEGVLDIIENYFEKN